VAVKTYESFEALREDISRAREQADEHAGDRGHLFIPGSHFARFVPEADTIIYGVVLDPIEEERSAGADESEIEYLRQTWESEHMANMRFCRCWSNMCLGGEYGAVHVVSMHIHLTAEEFARAREAAWPSAPADFAETVLALRLLPGGQA
jgi:hypothetical protein